VGTGAFNITRLIAELGLKNVDLDLIERIQPTMNVGDLSDVTPPHVAPSAIFGGFQAAVPGEVWAMEIQCLSPGGAFIDWISYQAATNANFTILTASISSGLAVLPPVGQASRDPILSIAKSGTHVFAGAIGAVISSVGNMHTFNVRSIFIPRGSFFSIQGATVNFQTSFGIGWREVPASEHVPS